MTNIVYELEKYLGKFKLFCINDFPINFSSIFNWLYKWYERGLSSYCDS